MNQDISGITGSWDYDPSSVTARWIKGNDGKLKVQLRLDLGLFQMEAEGRPDGTHPRGYPSLLDFYLALEKTSPQTKKAFTLNAESCAELQQEAMQYYYRYLSFYALRHFDGVVGDTEHNLGLLELVQRHADDEDLVWQFLQFYPYVRMMNARARAERAMEAKHHEQAVRALQKALDDIQAFWNEHGESEGFGGSQEIDLLTDLLSQVKQHTPKSTADRLREQLDHAISVENYEKAAVLRDRLNDLSHKQSGPGDESSNA
ncbi:MAG: UvrB/UvrC motif-containing protein [Verrucomicrobiota bacterium]